MKKESEVTRKYRKCNKCVFFVLADGSEPDMPYCTKLACSVYYKMTLPCEVKHLTVEKELA